MFAEDPNWGRIIMAIGHSGAEIYEGTLNISIGNISICENGISLLENETEISKYLENEEIKIIVDLQSGQYEATVWGCDLSLEYININADYRS